MRGGFSVPFKEIRDNVRELSGLLASAADQVETEMSANGSKTDDLILRLPESVFDLQLYSRAIQVFGAMAVEAALNTYGLMRFGADQLEAYRGGIKRKLHDFLDHKYATPFAKDDPVVIAMGRLVARRNAIVHAKADESTVDEHGQFTYVTPRNWPPVTVEAAVASIDEMELFFKEFPHRDPDTAMFFLTY
jgi:hypothetical protein